MRCVSVPPARGVCSCRRRGLNPRHHFVKVHGVVPQTRNVIAILLVAIPAVLRPLAVIHDELEWLRALQTCAYIPHSDNSSLACCQVLVAAATAANVNVDLAVS